MKKSPARTTTKTKTWTDPIPTKLDPTDFAWLELLCTRSELKRAQVIRRSLRLLAKEVAARPDWNWQHDTAKPLPPLTPEQQRELDGVAEPANAFEETNARARAAAERERQEKLAAAEAEAKRLEEAAAKAQAEARRLRGH